MRSAMQAQWAAVDMLLGFIQLGGGVGSNSHHRNHVGAGARMRVDRPSGCVAWSWMLFDSDYFQWRGGGRTVRKVLWRVHWPSY